MLSSDELQNDVISHVCTSFLVCLFSCYILYFVYDLINNNNNNGHRQYVLGSDNSMRILYTNKYVLGSGSRKCQTGNTHILLLLLLLILCKRGRAETASVSQLVILWDVHAVEALVDISSWLIDRVTRPVKLNSSVQLSRQTRLSWCRRAAGR